MGLFHERADEASRVTDGREIEEQTLGTGELLNPILSRELVVRKDAMFRREPDTNRHGLSRFGLAFSDTPHGVTTRLVPCEEGDEGAKLCSFSLPRGNKASTVEGWMRPVLLPLQSEVIAKIATMSDKKVDSVRVRYGARDREELGLRYPAQDRSPMLIAKKALLMTGTRVDELTFAELRRLELCFEVLGSEQEEEEKKDALSLIQATSVDFGLSPSQVYEAVVNRLESEVVMQEIWGSDAVSDSHDLDIFDPQPEEPLLWGLPVELVLPTRFPNSWEDFLRVCPSIILKDDPAFEEEGDFAVLPTRRNINKLSLNRVGFELLPAKHAPSGHKGGPDEFPTWKELRGAIVRVETAYKRKLEAWQLRRDPTARWVNLGEMVQNLGDVSHPEDMMGFWELSPGDLEVRPKPSVIQCDPADLPEADAVWLEKQILQAGTAEDRTIWMGDCGDFASDLPIETRKINGEDGELAISGHPLGELIVEMFKGFKRDRSDWEVDEEALDASEMVRLYWMDGSLPMVDHEIVTPEGKRTVQAFAYSPIYEGMTFYALISELDIFSTREEFFQIWEKVPFYLNGRQLDDIEMSLSPGKYVLTIGGGTWELFVPNGQLKSWTPMMPVGAVSKKKRGHLTTCEALCRLWHEAPRRGYNHWLYRLVAGEMVAVDDQDPLLAIFPPDDENFTVTFKSHLEWILCREAARMTPTIILEEDQNGDFLPVMAEVEAQEIYPKLFSFLRELLELWHEGVTSAKANEEWAGNFQALSDELSSVQRRSLRLLVQSNFFHVTGLMDDLAEATAQASISPENFQHMRFMNAWGKEDYAYSALLKVGPGRIWEVLKKLQPGPNCQVVLPSEAWDAPEQFWRAMGYKIGHKDVPDVSYVQQMVAETFIHHPFQNGGWKFIEGRVRRSRGLGLWLKPWKTSCGIIGDMRHQLVQVMGLGNDRWEGFFPELPGVELLRPSQEDFEAASWDYEGALRLHLNRIWEKNGWASPSLALQVLKGWGRVASFEEAKEQRKGLLYTLFPNPTRHPVLCPKSKAFGSEESYEAYKDFLLGLEGREHLLAVDQRVQALSASPKLARLFIQAARKAQTSEKKDRVHEILMDKVQVVGGMVGNYVLRLLNE